MWAKYDTNFLPFMSIVRHPRHPYHKVRKDYHEGNESIYLHRSGPLLAMALTGQIIAMVDMVLLVFPAFPSTESFGISEIFGPTFLWFVPEVAASRKFRSPHVLQRKSFSRFPFLWFVPELCRHGNHFKDFMFLIFWLWAPNTHYHHTQKDYQINSKTISVR